MSGAIGTMSQALGFLSDVHGNLEALEAVLDELARQGVRHVFVAGDLLYGGAKPLEVWRRLQQSGAHCTRGLSDTALALVDPAGLRPGDDQERSMAERFATTRASLGDLVIEQLRRLPERLRIPLVDGREIVMVHGSPADPSQEISHDMEDEEVGALIGDDPADFVVCGGSHVPFQRDLGEVRVINVGSVGAAPEGRVAHFTIIVPHLEATEIHQEHLEY